MNEIRITMTKAARNVYAKEGLADNKKLLEYLNNTGHYLGKVVGVSIDGDPVYKVSASV